MLNHCQFENRVKTHWAKTQGQKIKAIRKVKIKMTCAFGEI